MNHKQKLGYILLGAGIMLVGITIGQFISPPIEAENNGVFDKITCFELEVIDGKGKTAAMLGSTREATGVFVFDKQGTPAVILSSSPKGNGVQVFNKQHQAVDLGSSSEGNGLTIRDQWGRTAVSLGASDESGAMEVHDKWGNVRWRAP